MLNINIYKSSAIQNISSKILKEALLGLIPQLTYVFNLSLTKGIFPQKWKTAIVIPLPKGGDRTDVNNTRPISLLPLPGKLLERLVHSRVWKYLEAHKLINDRQHGFRAGHSTTATVSTIVDSLLEAANKKQHSLAVYIDFRKAFDTVNHRILLQKLDMLGIKDNCLQWFKDYLTLRKQRTFANNCMSESAVIKCGVPQGSILGPTLFLLHVNDISDAVEQCQTLMYADDTVLYYSHHDIDLLTQAVQSDLNQLSSWCQKNQLTINSKKTKVMYFSPTQRKLELQTPKITMLNETLEYVLAYKYLGIVVDNKLTFSQHINNIIKTAGQKIYILAKVRKYINTAAALMLYKSMILSHIDYGDIFLNLAPKTQLNKLQVLQNRALRICHQTFIQDRQPSTLELHVNRNLLKLDKRRELHMLNLMHNRVYRDPKSPRAANRPTMQTRIHDAPVLPITRPNSEKFRKGPMYAGGLLWNALPNDIRNQHKTTCFKNTLKRVYIEKQKAELILRN